MENPQQAGDRLHQAITSGKNKEDIALNIAMTNDLSHRVTIAQYYQAAYTNALYDDLKSKIGGDFGNAVALMFLSPLDFCIKMLKKAFKGFSTDEECIFEMLTSKTTDELKLIEEAYQREVGKSLQEELGKEFSGVLKKNVLNLFVTQRTFNPNPKKAECEAMANTLIDVGESNWVGDENIFREIFLKRSPEELILIARYYLKKTNKNLLDVVDKKLSGKNKTLLREVLYNNIMPHELFAEKLNKSVKGAGTNENLLSRVLVSRCELDMPAIRDMYAHKYKVSLKADVEDDTSGNYKKLCSYLTMK